MVIRGAIRSNGRQLSHYLLSTKENEKVEILEVNGELDADAKSLHMALHQMDLTTELSSRTDKGLYHAVLNPAYGEDKTMTPERWLEAADIHAANLGFEDARRVIVLHTKKGRTHAHVVYERWDVAKNRMVPNDHSRIKQDKARLEIERALNHKETPFRNKHRPEMKASIYQLWHSTSTGAQFVHAARENNYIIAGGSGRRPFMVIDAHGRSFDLVRQIKDVRTKDVRERLQGLPLMGEKDAITYMQKEKGRKAAEEQRDNAERQQRRQQHIDEQKRLFEENQAKITRQQEQAASKARDEAAKRKQQAEQTLKQFSLNKQKIEKTKAELEHRKKFIKQQKEKQRARKIVAQKKTVQAKQTAADIRKTVEAKKEARREQFRKDMEEINKQIQKQRDRDKNKDHGPEPNY